MKQTAAGLPVYLDYQATTPMDGRVLEAMRPYFSDQFGNPHSINHAYGWQASNAVQVARGQVADFLNADDDEILFTSGATESCNLALRGAAYAAAGSPRKKLITCQTEHSAVLDTILGLGEEGFEVSVLPIQSDGLIDITGLMREIDARTLLVSVMAGNNEIGVIQPIGEIARLCQARGVLLHTDATQAAGRIEINVENWNVDLLSLSGHKMYGPKGIGALFVRKGVRLRPVMTGGGQQRGIRPGTVPTALAVGLGEACRTASREREQDAARMSELTQQLWEGIRRIFPEALRFGHARRHLPGTLTIGLPGVTAHQAVDLVADQIAVSTGSACTSGTSEPSRVLLALGLGTETAATGIRISLGRPTQKEEIEAAVQAFARMAKMLLN